MIKVDRKTAGLAAEHAVETGKLSGADQQGRRILRICDVAARNVTKFHLTKEEFLAIRRKYYELGGRT